MLRLAGHTASGFTLTEALLSAVILSASVSAIIYPFATGAQHEVEDSRRTLATALAQEMMEEILAAEFPPVGQSLGSKPAKRSNFTRMDHYDGLVESGSQIKSYDGRSMGSLEGFTREVDVEFVHLQGQDQGQPPEFVRITVTMRFGENELCHLSRLAYAYPAGKE